MKNREYSDLIERLFGKENIENETCEYALHFIDMVANFETKRFIILKSKIYIILESLDRLLTINNDCYSLNEYEIFVNHDYILYRAAISLNINLPKEFFNILVEDSSLFVRSRLVLNRNIPADVLDKLRLDTSPVIQQAFEYRETSNWEWGIYNYWLIPLEIPNNDLNAAKDSY